MVWLALSACTGGDPEMKIISDYELHLVPKVARNQDPISGSRDVKLAFRDKSGNVDIHYLGSADDTLELGEQPPLDMTRIGLLVEEPGGQLTAYNPTQLVAYGEVGPFSLDTGGDRIDAEIFLAEANGVADLEELEDPAYWAGVGLTPDNDLYVFGGENTPANIVSSADKVQFLSAASLASGDWTFEEVGDLKDFSSDENKVWHTVTWLPEQGQFLVAGGRSSNDAISQNSADAFLFDPATQSATWNGADAMVASRSEHISVLLDDGRVLIIGGIFDDGLVQQRASFEFFDPEKERFTAGAGNVDTPSLGSAVASLGTDGAIVCGGAIFNQMNGTVSADADCSIIALSGSASATAELPEPRYRHAMIALEDGRVLATGGVNATLGSGQVAPAHDTAWVYDPGTEIWTPTEPMIHARAQHTMVPMPDGRILVLGGATEGGNIDPRPSDVVDCPEIFDPALLQFAEGGSCGVGGADVRAMAQTQGVFVLSGFRFGLQHQGSKAFGYVSFGPQGL